jgi:hypothetical protein
MGFARERLPVLAEQAPTAPDPAALTAPPIRFRVLVEQGLEPDADAFARTVEEVLLSPNGWAAAGASFVWVEQDFDITVLLASPKTTDTLCKPFDTGGKLSCANGLRANLNHWRWTHGADSWPDDLAGYRRYLVSHEVGHLLGMRHQDCPKAGDPAPIMMQQSKGVGGCKPNHEPVALELKLMRAQQEARRKLALKAAPKPSKAHKPIPIPNIQGP